MAKKSKELAKIILKIPVGSAIGIFPHVGVDSDCLGSTLALKFALEELGMNALVFTNEPIPDKFFFLPRIQEIQVFTAGTDPKQFIAQVFNRDTLHFGILVDCSNPGRIGECEPLYLESEQKMVLDHHFSSSCVEDLCIIDTLASASGEIIYNLIVSLEKESGRAIFNIDIATVLMAAIMADTGGFRYPNTNKESFGIAYDLFSRFPLDLKFLNYHLFEKTSLSRIHLQGKAYGALQFHEDNKIVDCLITQAMMEECNAKEGDVDGICSDLKNIEGIIVAFVLRVRNNGEIKVNIRSSEGFDASSFAASFGGGGHMRAAGFTMTDVTLEEAHQVIVKKSTEILRESLAGNAT